MSKLFPSYDNLSEEELFNTKAPIFKNIDYKITTIIEMINNIENLNDEQIKNIILRQHDIILDYDLFLSSESSRKSAQKMFSNKKFLDILLSQLGFLNLSEREIICINKLAYDYYMIPTKEPDVSHLLLQISYNINNLDVIKLSSKLGINGAVVLAMINKSSFKLEKRIHRNNSFLVKYNMDLSVQDMIDIMCILYDRFTYPIIYTMLEKMPDNLSHEEKIRFKNISLAISKILLSLTSSNMEKVLYDYAFMLSNVKQESNVRFSLKSINDNRLQSIIWNIENCGDFENLKII